MKIAIRIIICTILAAIALTLATFTIADFRRANAARSAKGYVLGAMGDSVAVYAGGDLKNPLDVTDIELASLRETDRELITKGMPVASREELLQLLEDLGG